MISWTTLDTEEINNINTIIVVDNFISRVRWRKNELRNLFSLKRHKHEYLKLQAENAESGKHGGSTLLPLGQKIQAST